MSKPQLFDGQRSNLIHSWYAAVTEEFSNYQLKTFRRDALSAITVAAVALPLALAFGVASGASASSGLVSSIIAGLLIGFIGGSPKQISGPTGGMSAIIITYVLRFGLDKLWVISIFAGVILIVFALLRFDRIIELVPVPIVVGFSSGIALIIFIGQIDNALGISRPALPNILAQIRFYLQGDFSINSSALFIALLSIVIVALWPRLPFSNLLPGSLVAIIVSTLAVVVLGLELRTIGSIPRTLLLEERASFADLINAESLKLIVPALSVATLASIQTLLVSSVIELRTSRRPDNKLELVAQGIGNIIIPMFGGVPGTAAIARTTVNLENDGVTRLVPMLHGAFLLLVVFALSPLLERIPLSTLAGVLMFMAWKMNDRIRFRRYAEGRHWHAIFPTLLTVFVIVFVDLIFAILFGTVASFLMIMFTLWTQKGQRGLPRGKYSPKVTTDTVVAGSLDGEIYFANAKSLTESISQHLGDAETVVIELGQTSIVDVTAAEVFSNLINGVLASGKQIWLMDLNDEGMNYLQQVNGSSVLELQAVPPDLKAVLQV